MSAAWAPVRLSLLVGMALGMPACRNDLDRVAQIEVPQDAPERMTTNAVYSFSDSGVVSNTLRAARIEEFGTEAERRTELNGGLELTFFDRSGVKRAILTAESGRILPAQRRMEVERNVVFVNAKGERLETEQLTWSQDSALIRTDRPVRITRAEDILHGEGMEATEDFSRYTIRRITGTLQAPVPAE
ncbi:MAG: LPS export ABC transporter periplasmic protein LptC [Flavobacteriales bacterium]|nr:LPS export ABC transporter periplasmic protein LptC [Flavobacteriales bacterium]